MAEAETEAEGPPRRKDHSGWDSVAERLLEQNFLLTALELYTESLETGREISRLRDFFSNPGNFGPTQPQQLTGLGRFKCYYDKTVLLYPTTPRTHENRLILILKYNPLI